MPPLPLTPGSSSGPAPPLLAATAVGAGIGAAAATTAKHHEEKTIGLDADELLRAYSSASGLGRRLPALGHHQQRRHEKAHGA